MNNHVIRYRDSFIGIRGFRQEFPDDFPARSDEAEQADAIEAALAAIEQFGGEQALNLGDMRFTYNSKGIARVNLREMLEDFETAGRSLAYKIPGIDLIFRVPSSLTDADMLALARSFVVQSPTYEIELKKRLGDAFIADFQTLIDDFDASLVPPAEAKSAKVENTAQLGESVRQGSIARRVLKDLMKLKYKNNPARYQAWLSASHLERTDKKDKTVETPPTA
jgi:hypothetical protein